MSLLNRLESNRVLLRDFGRRTHAGGEAEREEGRAHCGPSLAPCRRPAAVRLALYPIVTLGKQLLNNIYYVCRSGIKRTSCAAK
jgi:hypothetical protein